MRDGAGKAAPRDETPTGLMELMRGRIECSILTEVQKKHREMQQKTRKKGEPRSTKKMGATRIQRRTSRSEGESKL